MTRRSTARRNRRPAWPRDARQLTPSPPGARPQLATVAQSGHPAARRFLEFFAVTIRNPNTRMSYYRAACQFFAWCDTNGLTELADIEPMHVAAYIETLLRKFEKPTTKRHLAALRMLFNWLITGQVIATNPAHSSPWPLDSIDISKVIGLRG